MKLATPIYELDPWSPLQGFCIVHTNSLESEKISSLLWELGLAIYDRNAAGMWPIDLLECMLNPLDKLGRGSSKRKPEIVSHFLNWVLQTEVSSAEYRKKSRNQSQKIGTKKSHGTSRKYLVLVSKLHGPETFPFDLFKFFLIYTSQFLVRILVLVWVSVLVWSRSRDFCIF